MRRSWQHQRATARFGQRRPSEQLETFTTPDAQIFRLNRHHGPDVGQIKHANQTRFALRHLAAGFLQDQILPQVEAWEEAGIPAALVRGLPCASVVRAVRRAEASQYLSRPYQGK